MKKTVEHITPSVQTCRGSIYRTRNDGRHKCRHSPLADKCHPYKDLKRNFLYNLITLFLLLVLFVSTSFATEVTVFGPNQYLRTTGPPNVYTDTFSATPGEGSLIIKNGDENGKHRVTSALIFVNGEQIFGPSDFKQKTYLMEAPVNLTDNNTLLVELRSKPGTYLNIRVKQDIDAPTVSINANPDAIKVNENSTLTWTSTNADSCEIDQGIGAVNVNGSTTVSPSSTTTYTITATGTGGTATASVTVTVTIPPLTVTITDPADGNEFTEQPITVTGTVTRTTATVIVNGIQATVTGNDFTAENIPLTPGSNTINALAEDGENTAVDSVTVTLMNIDLEPVHIEITSLIEDPQALRVSGEILVTIINNGGGDIISPYQMILFEDINFTRAYEAGEDNLLAETSISSGPMAGGSINSAIQFYGELLFRGSPIHVFVDSANNQEETDETNNIISTQPAGLDSSASYLSSDETGCPNSVTLTVRIGNSGGLEIIPGVSVAFYAGDPDSGGELIGTALTTQALDPGRYEDLTLTWSDPSQGTKAIYVRADDDGEGMGILEEMDEENNQVMSELSICGSPPMPEPDSLSGCVIDAVTGDSLSGVEVFLHADEDGNPGAIISQYTTGENGWFFFSALDPGSYILKASPAGYISESRQVVLASGQGLTHQDLVLSPVLSEEEIRVVLAWGESPEDLDAHLTAPNPGACRYHCFYWNKTIPGASLDTDDNDSYGPETITITQRTSGTYRFYVYDWPNRLSNTSQALSISGAQVKIYKGNEEDPLVFTPPAGAGNVWHVFNLDGDTGEITPINRMTYQKDPGKIDYPVITSYPIKSASLGSLYTYQIQAEDPDLDTLTFTLLLGPEGMSLDQETGLIQWTPATGQAGKRFTVSVIVNDGRCGEDTQEFEIEVTYRPIIDLFTVDHCSGFNPGGDITLRWSVRRADTCIINHGIGEVPFSGSMTIPSPDEPTSYTLTATNGAGETTKKAPDQPPRIIFFQADPENILLGESTTLSWETQCAFSCELDHGIGNVSLSGSVDVTPAVIPVTYTLTAYGPGGNPDRDSVSIPPLPKIDSFSANPLNLEPGESTTLSWSTSHSDTCTLNQGIGEVNTSGTITVTPDDSPTNYMLTATNEYGSVTRGLQVSFYSPSATFSASPGVIKEGESSILTWTTQHATSCTISPVIGIVDLNGSITVSPDETTTYTLTAEGPGGTKTKTATVAFLTPTAQIMANPDYIGLGESTTLSWLFTNADICIIEPGIGEVQTGESITLSPDWTTTYTITATGPGGTAVDSVTVTVLNIKIEYPPDGSTLYAQPITVAGMVGDPLAPVLVNGIEARVEADGNFEVEGISLDEGINTITAYTEKNGKTAEASITVNLDTVSCAGTDVPVIYPTIQAAIDAAVPGQVITVCPGIYRENLDFNGKSITIISRDGPQTTTIDGTHSGPVVSFSSGEDAQSILSGFTITKGLPGISCYYASPTVFNCIIIANEGGINCDGYASPTIRQCTITGNMSGNGGGIDISSGDPLIDTCIIKGNTSSHRGGGIYCSGGSYGNSSSPQLINTLIIGNEALSGEGGAMYAWEHCDPVFTHCTIAHNTADSSHGLYLYFNCHLYMTNSILWNDSPISSYTQLTTTITYSDIKGGRAGEGNIDADPVFKDPENGDYHLSEGSPCIDAGKALDTPLLDMDGETRPIGPGFDMGADEYYPGPEIEITSPINGQVFDKEAITVKGTVNTDDLTVTINGQAISAEDHAFTLTGFPLTLGENSIVAMAEDRYGASLSHEITIFYDPSSVPTIKITSPLNGELITSMPITVTGVCGDMVSSVTINGQDAIVEGGIFTLYDFELLRGEHTITARAYDAEGALMGMDWISVTVELPLEIQITSPSDNDLVDTESIKVTGRVNDAEAQVSVNDAQVTNDQGTFTVSVSLDSGHNTILARAIFGEEIVEDEISIFYYVPGSLYINIDTPKNGQTVPLSDPAEITVSGTLNAPGDSVTVNGEPAQLSPDGSFTYTYTLTPGTNIILIDAAFMGDTARAGRTVFYGEPTPLTISIVSPQDGANINDSYVTVQGTVNNPLASVTINGNWASKKPDGSFLSSIELESGTNLIVARARYGEEIVYHKIRVYTGSGGQPCGWHGGEFFISIDNPVDGQSVDEEQIIVSGSVDLMGLPMYGELTVMVNGEYADVMGNNFDASIWLFEGENVIQVEAIYRYMDESGFEMEAFADAGICVYYVPGGSGGNLDIVIVSPSDWEMVGKDTVLIEGFVSNPDAQVNVNGEGVSVDGEGKFSLSVTLNPGENVITAQAEYNMSTAQAEITVIYEPLIMVEITSPQDGAIFYTTPITVTGTIDEDEATVTVNGIAATVSDGAFTAENVPLTPGANTITARAVHEMGTGEDTITITYTIDTVAPNAEITSPEDGATVYTPAITVSGSIDDPTARVTVNGVEATVSDGTFTAENITLTLGSNTIAAIATDPAGNTGTHAITITYETPITIQIESPADGSTVYKPTVTVTGIVSDYNATVTVNGINATVENGQFTAKDVPLADGENTITAEANYNGNIATDSITLTYINPITITITSPDDGATIDSSEIIVTGTVSSDLQGFMVEVNGIQAEINGEQYSAFGVPLSVGTNEIIAKATDIYGNTKEAGITIYTNEAASSKVKLDATPKSGTAPLEVSFTIEYSYPEIPAMIVSAAIDWEGDGIDDYTPTAISFTYTYNQEGLFYPKVTLTDEIGNVYTAQAAINVYPMPDLVQIWNDMKARLIEGDIEGALSYHHGVHKDKYEAIYNLLGSDLANKVNQMQDIELIYAKGERAKYRIRRDHEIEGQTVTITYYVYFSRDRYGLWKIEKY